MEDKTFFDVLILAVDAALTKLGKSANIRKLQLCKVNINNEYKQQNARTDSGSRQISDYKRGELP